MERHELQTREQMLSGLASSDATTVTVSGGKYTMKQLEPGKWTALRYGEEWPAFRDSDPDNLHVALALEVARLRGVLSAIAEVDDDGFTSDGHERSSEIAARALAVSA